ncbi:helix-turn-helix domain-containing protein [Limosilactobacillus reuteri]|uniref:helix-turn-helix domain-containing protein n=1 Tax=Limosilactobacillus reuteri TaxID=1598 RepID=UPI00232D35C6|nr:helix-turn-helix domain-containing protein [Limosilactobacillus reuteri]
MAAKFNIERSLVYSWYRKYKNEGIVGLRTKAKGRPRKTMNNKKVKRSSLTPTEKEQYQQTIADLKAQLAHERMKNEILKKLRALRQQEDKNKPK